MAKKQLIYEAMADMYVGGQFVSRGSTVVHGHPLLKGRTKLFRPFVPTYGDLDSVDVPEYEEPERPTKAEKAQAAEDQKEATDEGDGAKAKANADGQGKDG